MSTQINETEKYHYETPPSNGKFHLRQVVHLEFNPGQSKITCTVVGVIEINAKSGKAKYKYNLDVWVEEGEKMARIQNVDEQYLSAA